MIILPPWVIYGGAALAGATAGVGLALIGSWQFAVIAICAAVPALIILVLEAG